jgi:UDP-galactopyranose mutase
VYKLATFNPKKKNIPLPNVFNIKRTVNLLNDLLNIPYNIKTKLVSFYFTDVYTSIPTKEVLDIITLMLDKNNTDIMLSQEILNIRRTISQHNYFLHNDTL